MKRKKRHGPGRPRADESSAHRDALLDTATAVFIEHGYEAASLNKIARRAGASKNTLYRLFPSKADLFMAVILRRIGARSIDVTQLFEDGAAEPRDVLRRVAVGLLRGALGDDQPQLRRIVMQAAHEFPELSRTYFETTTAPLIDRIARYLRRVADSGYLTIDDANQAADVFLSLVVGLTLTLFDLKVLSPDSAWIERRASERVDAFLRLYAAETRERRRSTGTRRARR